MRPQDVLASVEPERWDEILSTVRESCPDLWRDLEKTAMADQRVPTKLWQRYSPDQRRTTMRRTLRAPASARLALDAVREYLLIAQRPLLIRFLDELSIPHEDGALGEEPLPEPEPARLDAAIDLLLAEYTRADVLLYLRTFAAHEHEPWPHLEERLAALEDPSGGAPPESPGPSGSPGRRGSAPGAPGSQPSPGSPPGPAAGDPTSAGNVAPEATQEHPAARAPRSVGTVAERRGSAGPERPPPPAPAEPEPPLARDAGGLDPHRQPNEPSTPDGGTPDAAPTPARLASSATGPMMEAMVASAPPEDPEGLAATVGHGMDPFERKLHRRERRAPRDALPGPDRPAPPAPPDTRAQDVVAPSAPASLNSAVSNPEVPPYPSAAVSVPEVPPYGSAVGERDEPAVPPASRIWPIPPAVPAPPAESPSDVHRDDAVPEALTALDKLLARTVVATLSGVRGAPSEAELWNIVDEVMHLSARRAQTHYHVGLLEALTDTAHEPDRRGWSSSRWDWYHYGRLVGWSRQQRWAEIARFYDVERAGARHLLRGPEGVAPWAGPLLFDGLLAADSPALAADVLRQFSPIAPLVYCEALLDAANTRLEENRAPEAYEILDVLEVLSPLPPATGSERDGDVLAAYRRRLRRGQAQTAQAQGLFGTARARFEAELAAASGADRADLLSDLGLVASELGRLAELDLPEADADPQPWIRRLEAGAPYFTEAVALAPYRSPAASFALGALEWLRQQTTSARRHFEAALQAMQERRLLYRRLGLFAAVQFYLGATLLLDFDPAARDRAVVLLREALAAGLKASDAAWGRLLDTVALEPALAPALFDVFSQQEPAPRQELAQAFLVRCALRSDAARRRLSQECDRESLPTAQRWELLCGLLEAERRAGGDDAARDTLDRLEALAHASSDASRQLLEHWCAFLARPENYEPIWSAEDVLWSRVRTFELLGRDDEAFWLLDMPFNRLLAEATPEALANAEALLARARQLGTGTEARVAVQEMATRLRARQDAGRPDAAGEAAQVAAQLRAGRSLRVLFLGGNETQERHEQDLRRALVRRDEASGAEVALTFMYPSFNSNWDKALETVRGMRGRLDALVLMPFVRTELGRAVRRMCSEFGVPWVACTGKGYDSMERALRTALELAAERPPPDRGARRAS